MSKIRILIPWDDLKLKHGNEWFNGYESSYQRFVEHCTTPLRNPDEWTEDDWYEFGWKLRGQKPAPAYWRGAEKALEIATRQKKSPEKEMDERVRVTLEILRDHGLPGYARELRDAWYYFKQELREGQDE